MRRSLQLALLLTIGVIGDARVAAQAQDENVISPYLLVAGRGSGAIERAVRYERLAEAALAARDHARAARHFVLACYYRSEPTFDFTLSAPACRRGRAIAREHGVIDASIYLLMSEGTLRAWSLDVNGAVARLQEGLKLGASLDPELPDNNPVSVTHFVLGAILIEAGQFDLARQELIVARRQCVAQGAVICVALTDTWICRLETQLGELRAARAACEAAEAGLDLDMFVNMDLGWIRGELEIAAGRMEAALASLQNGWRAAQVSGGELLRPTLMLWLADVNFRLGRLDDAEVWQQMLERAQASGRLPATYEPQTLLRRGQIEMARGHVVAAVAALERATASPMHETAIDADYALAQARRQLGDLPGARQALERAIARIESGRTNVAGATIRASYLDVHARTYRELVDVRWSAEGAAAAPALLEIAEAGRARALLDQLTSAQVPGAAAPTMSAAAVQATLGTNDVLVEYVSAVNRLLAVTVTRDRISVTPLPDAGTSDSLAQRVDYFASLVQERSEAALRPVGARLYKDLLGPALAGVPPSATTLIIAADGPLHRLPFDAIGDGRLLIDRWNIVTLPSASALAKRSSDRAASRAALVIASPAVAGMDALPAAEAEAAALRGRISGDITELSGASASEGALQAAGPDRYALLHFASHAVVDESLPLRSALMLTPEGGAFDGRWSAEEIYRASLNADLVVLSACSTAAGAASAGEGVMSLSRAFLYAGAGATIATRWDVPDAPAPVFADVLYRELGAGQPLVAAAAEARRALRRRGAPPRSWAAYVLTGSPSAHVRVSARVPGNMLAASGAAAGSVFLLIVALAGSRLAKSMS